MDAECSVALDIWTPISVIIMSYRVHLLLHFVFGEVPKELHHVRGWEGISFHTITMA